MSKKPLLLGAVASIIAINSVFADTTVTSRNYVDTQVATKQNKIDATGANFTNGSVVETTSTPGVVTQRGIFNPDTDFDWENNEVVSGHEDDLVTADIYNQVDDIYNQINGLGEQIQQATNLPQTTVTYKSCTEWVSGQLHTDANCILWNLSDTVVYGCRINADCNDCTKMCSEGKCVPNPDAMC